MFAKGNLIEILTIPGSLQSVRILVATGEFKKMCPSCWDEHWVLYGNQFDNKFHKKNNKVCPRCSHWNFSAPCVFQILAPSSFGWLSSSKSAWEVRKRVSSLRTEHSLALYWQKLCLISVPNTWLIKP